MTPRASAESSNKASIIATVGPACDSSRALKALVNAGATTLRINASHTTPITLMATIQKINRVFEGSKLRPKIMVDLQGPRVRTGKLRRHRPLLLKPKESVRIRIGSGMGGNGVITTACKELPEMVQPGDVIMIDNGMIRLRVRSKNSGSVLCRVDAGGLLGENKGINLPQAGPTLPALTEKDQRDLEAILPLRYDSIALSFVRTAEDLLVLKKWLKEHEKMSWIIAKLEKPSALKNLKRIMKVSDEIMIARGDLGIELGIEKVPILQKQIMRRARRAKIPVIVATQMLESMMKSPVPYRAEVSDVANAVLDGARALMLSGETSIGMYPVETARMMKRIMMITDSYKRRKTSFMPEMM